ncbi:MAG: hypothetical protein ACOCWH_00280 [Spirochaetota bacterium]
MNVLVAKHAVRSLILIGSLVIFGVSCTSANNVRRIVQEKDTFEDVDSIAVIVRLSESSRITHEEYLNNLNTWLSGYQTEKKVRIVSSDDALSVYSSQNERFYQVSAGREFLKYKSLGMVRTVLAANRNEIRDLMRANDTDYLLLYEIGGAYSPYLKAINYNSVIVIINRDTEIVYLDHQQKYVGSGEFDRDNMKQEFVDSVARRLSVTLTDIKLLSDM